MGAQFCLCCELSYFRRKNDRRHPKPPSYYWSFVICHSPQPRLRSAQVATQLFNDVQICICNHIWCFDYRDQDWIAEIGKRHCERLRLCNIEPNLVTVCYQSIHWDSQRYYWITMISKKLLLLFLVFSSFCAFAHSNRIDEQKDLILNDSLPPAEVMLKMALYENGERTP